MATNMARKMVTEWGLSDDLGPLRYTSDQEEVFLGHSVAQSKNMSDETAAKIDSEIKRIVNEAYQKARKILTDHGDQLEKLAKGLLEYETLSGDEIKDLLDGKPIIRDDSNDTKPPSQPSASVPKTS